MLVAMPCESARIDAHVLPEGTRVVTASEDNTARVWDVALSTLSLRALTDRAREQLPREAHTDAEKRQFFVSAQ